MTKTISSCGYTGVLRGSPSQTELYPKIPQDYIDRISAGPKAGKPLKLSDLFHGPHDKDF